jgi:predicted AAA+ superfamily ATPase
MSQLPFQVILERNKVFEEFNGALTEQYVLQQLSSIITGSIYYWTSEATAGVDFVISNGTGVIPVEVKAGVNVKAKSLRVYIDRYQPEISIRTSLSNVHRDGSLLNIPLSMVFHLEQYLELCKNPDT